MRTKEEILEDMGVTPDSNRHSYQYLYKCMLESMEEYKRSNVKQQ